MQHGDAQLDEASYRAPVFPYIPEPCIPMTQDFRWSYADRRSLQEIVPGIFVGPMATVRDREVLERCKISMLVAVRTPSTINLFKPKFPSFYRYETFDIVEGSLLSSLSRVRPLIEAALHRGERLLFYDETGNAKAPVLVCAYLMESRDISAQEAYHLVKAKRLSVSLSNHERYQLEEYETLVKARNHVISHPYSDAELQRQDRRRKLSESECENAGSQPRDVSLLGKVYRQDEEQAMEE